MWGHEALAGMYSGINLKISLFLGLQFSGLLRRSSLKAVVYVRWQRFVLQSLISLVKATDIFAFIIH